MNRLEMLQDIINDAKKHGASDAEAIIIDSISNSIEVRLGKPTSIEYSQDESIGLRVLIDGQQAIASTSDFSKDSLNALIEKSIFMAKSVPKNPHLFLAKEDQLCKNFRDLKLYDDYEPTTEKLLEVATESESIALEEKEISNSEGSAAGFSKNKIYFATSTGFSHEYKTSYFSQSTSVIAGKDEHMQTDYGYTVARFWQDLQSPKDVGSEAGKRAAKKLYPKKITSSVLPVIFENRIASSLLSAFLAAINGSSISRGTSFLIDSLEKEIFNSSINIIDDPFIIKGLSSRPFDGEGLEGKKLNLVEKGILKDLLLDLQTASKLGKTSNGRAGRGLSSIPTPSSSNSYIKEGSCSLDETVKSIKNGLLITSIFGHGANVITGEYSQGAAGFYIENGEILYPVSEITIAGNLKEMFKAMTPLSDLKMEKSINSPSLLVEKMTIAGV